jgi:hypothetical protein
MKETVRSRQFSTFLFYLHYKMVSDAMSQPLTYPVTERVEKKYCWKFCNPMEPKCCFHRTWLVILALHMRRPQNHSHFGHIRRGRL